MQARIQNPDGDYLFSIPLEDAQAASLKGEMYLHGRVRRSLIYRLVYPPGVIKHLDPSTLTLADTLACAGLTKMTSRRWERLEGYLNPKNLIGIKHGSTRRQAAWSGS